MTKPVLTFLLIFTMIIAPIASAFEHCAGMDMSEQSPDNQSMTIALSVNDTASSSTDTLLNGHLADMDCHASSHCTFHVCGGAGIISSATSIQLQGSAYYSQFKSISPYSTVLPLDLRPPITIL